MVVVAGMSAAELDVLRATEPAALAQLDEDELLDLHARVRRARTKHVGQYRRQGAARVAEAGSRGAASAGGGRARDKAEVFEAALARVSTAVAKAARASAAELRAQRLAAARAARSSGPAGAPSAAAAPDGHQPAVRRATKTTGGRKRDASTRAKGARRQASRDAR